jgi:DNA-binding beta-propeller fold protein YncE
MMLFRAVRRMVPVLFVLAVLISWPNVGTSAQSVVTTVPVSFAPVGIGVNPSTNRIYVANQNADTVSVI